jgi:uncharacterized protein
MLYMNQASQLYQLQKIDTELDQSNTRLKEINRLMEADEVVRKAKEKADQAKAALAKTRRKLQDAEEAVTSVRIKINTSESSLYGGKIRNPKELQDLQIEITALKRRLSALEDEQLEFMVSVEQCEADEKAELENLSNITAQHFGQQASLRGEQSQLIKNSEKLQTMRSVTLASILPENLEIYERLRKQKRGIAVSVVEESACSACGATARPSELQSARLSSQQMPFCSSCGRILYAG